MRESALFVRLAEVRAGAPRIDEVPPAERPPSLAAAYEIAAALTHGQPLAGYKVGATSAAGRDLLRLTQPFYGRILASSLQRSPGVVRCAFDTLAAEPEIAFELGTDLPPRERPYARGEIAAAVRRVLPIIELNAPSFIKPFEAGGLCLIADNGVNAGAVVGGPGAVRLDIITETQVSLSIDGQDTGHGAAPAAPDDPLAVLCWLANTLAAQGTGLAGGQLVATGAMTAPITIATECVLEADFGLLGAVQVTFVQR